MQKLELKNQGEYTLFVRFSERGVREYVVAYGYNEETDEWAHGTYVQDLETALRIYKEKTHNFYYELCTKQKNGTWYRSYFTSETIDWDYIERLKEGQYCTEFAGLKEISEQEYYENK